MPTRPPQACKQPGCTGIVLEGVCTVCGPVVKEKAWERSPSKGGYGWDWWKVRNKKLAKNPVCEDCEVFPAEHVHHIKPFDGPKDPLRLEMSNLQSVCAYCHARATRRRRK